MPNARPPAGPQPRQPVRHNAVGRELAPLAWPQVNRATLHSSEDEVLGRKRMSKDWSAVEAAAKRAGWKRSGSLLRGPCPVTDEEYCTVEPGDLASDGVLMKCYAPRCKKLGPKLGGTRYHQHKDALLARLGISGQVPGDAPASTSTVEA